MRIRYRFLLAFASVVAVGSIVSFVAISGSAERLLLEYVRATDREEARFYAGAAAFRMDAKPGWEGLGEYLAAFRLDQAPRHRLAIVDSSGLVRVDTDGAWTGTVHPKRHFEKGEPISVGGEVVGHAFVGSMVDASLGTAGDLFIAAVTESILVATLISAITAMAMGWALSTALARPLARLTGAVETVAKGDLGSAVPPEGDFELKRLASGFNSMTASLRRLEEEKRRIIADSAHELRTPVTLIRGTVEAMIDGVYPRDDATLLSVHEETVRLSRLIDTLRELELVESERLTLDLSPIDPRRLALEAVAAFDPAARKKTVEVALMAETCPSIEADDVRLREVLYNLLTNALRHVPSGGKIEVSARPTPEGMVRIAVEDSGQGIPEDQRERVFERFYRLAASLSSDSGGRGIGLSIAREIIRAHGGSLRAESSQSLGGAAFIIELPVKRFQN